MAPVWLRAGQIGLDGAESASRGEVALASVPSGYARSVRACLTKWVYAARLETRTKESNMCASTRVANPSAE